MPSYIVEVYVPRSRARAARDTGDRVHAAIDELVREGVAVRHVRATVLPDDEMCFHLFEASDPAAVEEVCRRAGLGRIRVVPAIEEPLRPRDDQSQA
jgi:hypothetical protein